MENKGIETITAQLLKKESKLTQELQEKLITLYALQVIDDLINEKKKVRGDIPRELQELEDEIIGTQARGQAIANEIRDMERRIKHLEQQKKESALKKTKAETSLEKVRTSEEYAKIQKEIEMHDIDIQLCDREIKSLKEKIKNYDAHKKDLEKEIQEKTKAMSEKKKQLEQLLKETQETEEVLIKIAELIEKTVDPRLLNAYKKIKGRLGSAVAPIERDACGGCHYRVPLQRQIEIKQHQKVYVCEYCGRILIDNFIKEEGFKKAQEFSQKFKIDITKEQ